MSRFKKGEWKKARPVIMCDLEILYDKAVPYLAGDDKEDFLYFYKTLKGNMEDLYEVKK